MPLFDIPKTKELPKTLREKFIVPPFSILDAKSGYWMKRKQAWETILKDREFNVRDIGVKNNTPYINQFDTEDFRGMKSPTAGNVSTFDPFLCEILIRWFSLAEMKILDPFAGGCVRGLISNFLQRKYYGIDISKKQCDHNYVQLNRIKDAYSLDTINSPTWICGDSELVLQDIDVQFDMLLMCPPYYNLEQYTKEPQDLSNQKTYSDFINKFARIIEKCYSVLRENSFAVAVVEEIRDEHGIMYGFVPDVIKTFTNCGFQYYNEIILENRVVSLGIRCPKYFDRSRKVGRHHQNILVFYKGNTDDIYEKFGKFDRT